MNFFNSVTNLIGVVSKSNQSVLLIVTLLLTESFLIYFNIKILNMLNVLNDINNDLTNINNDLIDMEDNFVTLFNVLKLLGDNQQNIFNFLQGKPLKLSNIKKYTDNEDIT